MSVLLHVNKIISIPVWKVFSVLCICDNIVILIINNYFFVIFLGTECNIRELGSVIAAMKYDEIHTLACTKG